MLKLENVSKFFIVKRGLLGMSLRLEAARGVSLQLRRGESLGLVGESGCGKSTLGRIACGLIKPDKGEVFYKDKKLPQASAKSWAAGKIQMIFQDPASSLNPRMKIIDSVAEPLQAIKTPKKQCRKMAEQLLESVGLKGAGNRFPHQFSGGQRQRIAVARALITNPDFIVCDEPVSALDTSVQAQILNLLKEMQTIFHPGYLFISHDLAVIGFICQRILVMYLGQIVEETSRENLFLHPAHPYSAALLATMPKGDKFFQESEKLPSSSFLSGELPSPLNPPAGCAFHPRCSKAQQICSEIPPSWTFLAEDWGFRCHFPNI